MSDIPGVSFNHDYKYDLQLSEALVNERRLGELFAFKGGEKIELKSESWQWERTGNIAVEYACDSEPSGIASSECDYWVHELKRDGETLLYIVVPVERMLALCRHYYKLGSFRTGVGDDGRFSVVLIPLAEILR